MITKSLPIFLVASTVGFLFSRLHVPLPWTLGPLLAAILWKSFVKKPVFWPKDLRNVSLIVLGYVLGSPFTPENGLQMLFQLPVMLIITLATVSLSLFSGYIAGRYSGIGLENSLIGSMPGGLSQMSVICEETEGANATIVTMMQTIRVVTVVFSVPFLALHGLADNVNAASRLTVPMGINELPLLACFTLVIISLIVLAKRLHLSSPYVIAPIVGTAALVLSGIHPPTLPFSVIAIAQTCVGIRMGLDVEFANLTNWKKIAYCSLLSVLSVIMLLLGIAYIFTRLTSTTLVTAFLSMAPGGISEMGLTATIVNANLSTVVSYQLFRLLFVLLVGVPAIRWWLGKINSPAETTT